MGIHVILCESYNIPEHSSICVSTSTCVIQKSRWSTCGMISDLESDLLIEQNFDFLMFQYTTLILYRKSSIKALGFKFFIVYNHLGSNRERGQIETINLLIWFHWRPGCIWGNTVTYIQGISIDRLLHVGWQIVSLLAIKMSNKLTEVLLLYSMAISPNTIPIKIYINKALTIIIIYVPLKSSLILYNLTHCEWLWYRAQ